MENKSSFLVYLHEGEAFVSTNNLLQLQTIKKQVSFEQLDDQRLGV